MEAILRLFWKPFNDEVFVKSKSWYNCGDFGCSVVCKKVWRGKKVDYERSTPWAHSSVITYLRRLCHSLT